MKMIGLRGVDGLILMLSSGAPRCGAFPSAKSLVIWRSRIVSESLSWLLAPP